MPSASTRIDETEGQRRSAQSRASIYTDTRGAAAHLTCSVSYLEKERVAGGGPRFIKIGKSVRYKIEDLDTWASGRTFASTSEYAA